MGVAISISKMVTAIIVLFCLFASVTSQELRASVLFNQGGVTGWISFTEQQSGTILIETNIRSEQTVDGWHVHNFPVDFIADPAERCDGAGGHYDPSNRFGIAGPNYTTVCNERAPLQCEAGDLSGKFGCLVTTAAADVVSYTSNDDELQLRGRYGIIGRSIVIHDPDGNRLACGNIVIDNDDPTILVATFVSPIAGSIYFRQSTSRPAVGTFIFANLYYVDGTSSISRNHNWHIHVNQPGYGYVTGDCSEVGPHYNPLGVDVDGPNYQYCNPSNISNCEVGDLSNKLGTVNVASDPGRPSLAAWNDANLHMYDIVDRSVAVHAAERGSPIIACAPLVRFAPLQAQAYRPPDPSLFSLTQASPFDPTMVTATVNLSADAYQINNDGNIRTQNDRTCYSDMVLSPFDVTPDVSTEDGFALGDISGKHGSSFTAGQNFNSDYFPLFNRYSTLGHNFMVNQSGSTSCGTINPAGPITVVQAWVNFTDSIRNGQIVFRQILTTQTDGSYSIGPTLVNYRFKYINRTIQTDGHNWHVHSARTGTDGPTAGSCDVVEGHYNPYRVNLMTNYGELCNSSDITRYPLRCEVGDLSGKHGRLSIRANDSDERTLVFYDPNLPLVGPYTILGRSIAIHDNTQAAPIISCSNIEPVVLSNTAIRLSYPTNADAPDPRIGIPEAIVNLLNNSNVMHGEVLVYGVNLTATTAANGTVNCTIVTLRFTEFTNNGNPEETARLVQGLNQDNLPAQYRSGVCPILDLNGQGGTGTPAVPRPNPDGAVIAKPLSMFIGAFVTLVLLTLANIV